MSPSKKEIKHLIRIIKAIQKRGLRCNVNEKNPLFKEAESNCKWLGRWYEMTILTENEFQSRKPRKEQGILIRNRQLGDHFGTVEMRIEI